MGDRARLPVPELEDTARAFLAVAKPLLSEEEQAEEEKRVRAFVENEGPGLQKALVKYAEQQHSYVESFWNDSYLTPNSTVVLNLNPFFVLADDPTPYRANQVVRAASLVFSALKFCATQRQGKLPPDVVRGNSLCMSQYDNLFGSARVPGKGKDRFVVHPHAAATHLVVMRHNQMYHFECLNADNTLALDEIDIVKNFAAIVNDADSIPLAEASRSAMGVLTTEQRTSWGAIRKRLEAKGGVNASILETIDQALFVVCLDHTAPASGEEMAANALHGSYDLKRDAQIGTCTNRWYDKLQLIVCANGSAGVNFEHCSVDGHTVLRFVSDVFADTILRFAQRITKSMPSSGGAYVSSLFPVGVSKEHGVNTDPMKLEWDVTPELRSEIHFAEVRISDKILQCDTKVLQFTGYGKDFIVANKMSPDAFVQLGIMYAHWKLYGWFVSQYEPVQTKAFHHGRTEAMRAVTPESIAFCKAFLSKDKTKEEKVQALRDALVKHSSIVKELSKGKGSERHLFALKCLAAQQGMAEPALFKGRGWEEVNNTVLSTSNCGNPALEFFGFGPVVKEGFGIGYIIKEDSVSFTITSYHRQTDRFAKLLNRHLVPEAEVRVGRQQDETPREVKFAPNAVPPAEASESASELHSESEGGDYDMWGDLNLVPQPVDAHRKRSVGRPINVMPDRSTWKDKAGRKKGNEGYQFGDFTRAGLRSLKKKFK